MGTIVVAVLLGDDSFSVAHLGDTRLYRVREKVIQQLTTDHSVVMEQVRRGLLTSEEAGHSHLQNMIARALGVWDTVEPELGTHSARSGDLLLCSDGFSRFVPEERTLAARGASSGFPASPGDVVGYAISRSTGQRTQRVRFCKAASDLSDT